MTAGRRWLLLCTTFLASAGLLTGGKLGAQDNGSHRLWQSNLSPEQIKAALARMGAGESGDLDPFQKLLKEYLEKNIKKGDPGKLDETIKKLTGNKQLMDQLKQLAKQKQTDPGRPGRPTQEELAELFKTKPGEFPKLPDNPDGLKPPPKTDPLVTPKELDPKPDPGNPLPGDEPIAPVAPPVKKDGKGNRSLDENPFPEPEEPGDPRTKSLEAFAALWERNIGPLDETPEVKRALFDLVSGNGFDFDLKDEKGNSLWDLLKNGDGGDSGFGDFLNGGAGGDWKLPQFEFPKLGWGSSRSNTPTPDAGDRSSRSWWNRDASRPRSSTSSGGGSWGIGLGGFGGVWLPLVLLLLVILGVFVWLKLKDMRGREARPAFAGDGLGPWPVDPRSIKTREDVVLAFEYLSVLICGPSAKTWTHSTIAEALSDLAETHGETAVMLARLYELARYAPLDEPLSQADLIEAKVLICDLAGVSY